MMENPQRIEAPNSHTDCAGAYITPLVSREGRSRSRARAASRGRGARSKSRSCRTRPDDVPESRVSQRSGSSRRSDAAPDSPRKVTRIRIKSKGGRQIDPETARRVVEERMKRGKDSKEPAQ